MATSFKKSIHALLHSVFPNPHPRYPKSHPRYHQVHSPGYLGNGKVKVKLFSHITKSCLTLWDPRDYSLPGFSVHGIFQRVLKRVAISFSRGPSNQGIEPRSSALQADALPREPPAMGSSLHYVPPFCLITYSLRKVLFLPTVIDLEQKRKIEGTQHVHHFHRSNQVLLVGVPEDTCPGDERSP